jgi:hypothetical protein
MGPFSMIHRRRADKGCSQIAARKSNCGLRAAKDRRRDFALPIRQPIITLAKHGIQQYIDFQPALANRQRVAHQPFVGMR